MVDEGTFDEIGQTDATLYGPRGLLVCGMTPTEQGIIRRLIQASPLAPLPLVFTSDALLDTTLRELLSMPDGTGFGQPCAARRAVVMSGLEERELHALMEGYRHLKLPAPLWATLTPISEGWTLRKLLKELAAEEAAMQSMA